MILVCFMLCAHNFISYVHNKIYRVRMPFFWYKRKWRTCVCKLCFSFKSEVYITIEVYSRKHLPFSISDAIFDARIACAKYRSHATGRRHAWVTYLRAVFRSRHECERVRASAMQAPPWMNSRRRLKRDSCVVYMHMCVHTCVCVFICVRARMQARRATDKHSRWWRIVNAERGDYPLCYFVIAQITFYWRNLYSIIPCVFHFPFELFVKRRYQRWSAGVKDTPTLQQRKSNNTREVILEKNYSRPSVRYRE